MADYHINDNGECIDLVDNGAGYDGTHSDLTEYSVVWDGIGLTWLLDISGVGTFTGPATAGDPSGSYTGGYTVSSGLCPASSSSGSSPSSGTAKTFASVSESSAAPSLEPT